MEIDMILAAIGSTEETSFRELCEALGDDCPRKGYPNEWANLFDALEDAEYQKLVKITRSGGRISSVILTTEGAARVRESRKGMFL